MAADRKKRAAEWGKGAGCLLAVMGTALAAGLRWAIDPYLENTSPYIVFYFPIALAAYFGGRGPGFTAAMLGTVTATLLFVPPRGSLRIEDPKDIPLLVFFLLSSALMVLLGAWASTGRREALTQAGRLRRTLESMRESYLLLDRDWRVLDLNGEAERVLERSRQALLGRNVWEAFPGARELRFGSEGDRAMGQRVPVRFEEFYPPLGKWLEMSAYPSEDGLAVFFRDVTAARRAEESLRESEKRYRIVADNTYDWEFWLSPAGGFLYNSPSCLNVTGYDAEAFEADPDLLQRIIHPEDRQRYTEHRGAGQQGCATEEVEFRIIRRDGAVRWLAHVCRPVYDAGQYLGIRGTNRDVTERKRAEEELEAARCSAERAKEVAERASRAKDHFLATLSHELRTPLTPVLATVSMLEVEPRLDHDTRQSLEVVRRNVELEARLIDDLLDVTRIARGKIELVKHLVPLCEVILEAVEVCRADIEARRLHFDVDLGPTAPYWVEVDTGRLQQVFWNLLKNAIKFTPQGGCVGIRCHRMNGDVIAEVHDSGEGIEPQALGRIFNAFEQGERAVTRQFGGLGLGLTISKALVEMHGGAISAHSEGKGKGASFRVKLPVASCQLLPPEPGAPSPETANRTLETRSLRVLLVEDHGDSAYILRRILASRGHKVEIAGDVATALDLAGRQPFDLLISDLGLPDASGLDLIRALRERGQRLPAIALSGYGQEEDIVRSKAAGFVEHLVKPVDFTVLREVVGRFAEGQGDEWSVVGGQQ